MNHKSLPKGIPSDSAWPENDLKAAEAAFGEVLAISRRLATQDPSNADWQRDLKAAQARVERVEAKMGKNKASTALSIFRFIGSLISRDKK